LPQRLQPLHLPLSAPRRSVRILSAVVQVATGPVLHVWQDFAVRNAVAAQAVGDKAPWLILQPSQQALEKAFGGRGVPVMLDQDVEHDAVLVHRAPEIMELAIDLQEHLILSAKSATCLAAATGAGKWAQLCCFELCAAGVATLKLLDYGGGRLPPLATS
jgi:hypothetical protein